MLNITSFPYQFQKIEGHVRTASVHKNYYTITSKVSLESA